MKNLKFQVAKKAKLETNPKSVESKEYDDLLNIFSKETQIQLSFIKNIIIKLY